MPKVENAIKRAAKICDEKLICHDPGHDDRWCSRCDAMLDAADQIQQKILKLLEKCCGHPDNDGNYCPRCHDAMYP